MPKTPAKTTGKSAAPASKVLPKSMATKPAPKRSSLAASSTAKASTVSSAPLNKTSKKLNELKSTATSPSANNSGATSTSIFSGVDRLRMVEEAAYYVAEKDGFRAGKEHDYWVQAEAQVERALQNAGRDDDRNGSRV